LWLRSARYLRAFGILFIYVPLSLLGWFIALALNHRHLQWPPTVASLRGVATIVVWLLALLVIFILTPATTAWWLARRGADSVVTTAYGQCYDVCLDPPGRFYARLGEMPRTARWYSLPFDWHSVVSPSDAQYELWVLAATGWVERVRRLGAPFREVSQPVPILPARNEPSAPDAHPTDGTGDNIAPGALDLDEEGATSDERQAMRQFARRANLGWRASTGYLALNGWTGVVGGSFGLLMLVGLIVIVALTLPRDWANSVRDPSSIGTILGLMAFFGALGLPCFAFGLYCLRAWRRYRPFDNAAPVIAQGEVLAWMEYRDLWWPSDWRQGKETLINLRMPDGHEHVFRIPIRYLHRVRQRGAPVRITYRPTTERVLDVANVDDPVEATEDRTAQP
jgi:hypothetical protein